MDPPERSKNVYFIRNIQILLMEVLTMYITIMRAGGKICILECV